MDEKGTGLTISTKVLKDLIKEKVEKVDDLQSTLIKLYNNSLTGRLLGTTEITSTKYSETASLINVVL